MTLARLLSVLTRELNAAGIDGAARDLRLLAAHGLGIPADRITLHLQDELTGEQITDLSALARARAAGCPVSRLTGGRLFWGRRFAVTDAVLDPRPETETLIAAALELPPPQTVLDLGTGSAAIAVTLSAEWPQARVTATDVSAAALNVAQANAAALGVAGRVTWLCSDWFADVRGRFDLIVSNPPYIALSEMPDLAPEVRLHDPHLALTDGADGLGAYRAIAARACDHLTPGGHLLVETGWQQGRAVADLFAGAGLCGLRVIADMDGRDRVVCGRRAG